jgi:hypothetical protein
MKVRLVHIHCPPSIVWGYIDTVCPECGEPVRCERHVYEWHDPEDIARGACKHVERLNCRWGKLAIRFNRSVRKLIRARGWTQTHAPLPWMQEGVGS